MGGAATVLAARRARVVVLGGLVVALAIWEAYAPKLPNVGDRWDVALVAVILLPATFAVVGLVQEHGRTRAALPVALTLIVLAVLCDLAGLAGAFNVAKLLALAFAGAWFLTLFDALSWVVLVSVLIPVVDIFSVYRGPTKVVIEDEPGLFDKISIAFRLPGEDASANLGPPDVLFFSFFLATTIRFGLRARATWLAMTAALSLTIVATYAFDLGGLPALPAICLGFLLPNADLIFRSLRPAQVE